MIESLYEPGESSKSTKNIIFELIPIFHGAIERYSTLVSQGLIL